MNEIKSTVKTYLSRQRTLSSKSLSTYLFGLNMFCDFVEKPAKDLSHHDLSNFITYMLKNQYADSTVGMYTSAIVGFFKWLAFERMWHGDMADIRYVAETEKPKMIQETPTYDIEVITALVEWAVHNLHKDIIAKRDAFLILTALSTGGRIGKELCALKRGKVDFETGRALVIGKGGKEGKLRFSNQAIRAGKIYLKARADLDGRSGQPLASLPLFASHRTSKNTKALTYIGAYKALKARARKLCGEDADTFHPHLLRHEFVSKILRETNNLKLAQELARHVKIATTQRYAHMSEDELDNGYNEVFNND